MLSLTHTTTILDYVRIERILATNGTPPQSSKQKGRISPGDCGKHAETAQTIHGASTCGRSSTGWLAKLASEPGESTRLTSVKPGANHEDSQVVLDSPDLSRRAGWPTVPSSDPADVPRSSCASLRPRGQLPLTAIFVVQVQTRSR